MNQCTTLAGLSGDTSTRVTQGVWLRLLYARGRTRQAVRV